MNKEKNISRIIILRLAFLLMLLAGAVVFDVYHNDTLAVNEQSQEKTASTNFDVAQVFYFNSGSSFKLTTRADKLLSCILHTANQDKFLSRFHNYRTFHLLKEESMTDRKPFHLMAHYIEFTSVQYSSPDDDHHIS